MDIAELTILAQKAIRSIRDNIASAGNTDKDALVSDISNLEKLIKDMKVFVKESKR